MKLRITVFTAYFICATAGGAVLADTTSPDMSALRLPSIQFPARLRECGSTALTDSSQPFVSGDVMQIVGGNAIVFVALTSRPAPEVKEVIGFFAIDFGKPTYVVMIPGTSEKFILLHPRVGFHTASFGTIDMFPNGELKQVSASGTCFQILDHQ